MKKKILALLIFFAEVFNINVSEIWVSMNGNDINEGTKEKPLATINMALRKAREWRRLQLSYKYNDGIKIIINSGTYEIIEPLFIRPEDSGTATSPTIIEGKGKVIFTGGLQLKGWKMIRHSKQFKGENKLWKIDAPVIAGRRLEIRQLYNDTIRAIRAKQFEKNVLDRIISFDKEKREIWIPTPENFNELAKTKNLEMLIHQRWAIAILRIKEMKSYGNNTKVSFYNPESRLEFEHPWPQPVIGGEKGNSSYCLMNAFSLLDNEGEWFQDYEDGTIYYIGDNPNNSEFVAPFAEKLVCLYGTSFKPVSNILFRNINFRHTSWLRPSQKGHVTLQAGFPLIDAYKLETPGLPYKRELENQAWVERPQSAIEIKHANNVGFDNCTFNNIGSTAVDIHLGIDSVFIKNSKFIDIGGTAIMGGIFPDYGCETHIPYISAFNNESCQNILISDCYISNASKEEWGSPAISMGYVANTNIEHNEICRVNYSGIAVGWGWSATPNFMKNNHITNNYIHHFAAQLYDVGGIYTLSNQPESSITGNRIENMIDAPYATNDRAFYIYLDEATDGFEITNNYMPDSSKIGYNTPGPSLKIGINGPNVDKKIIMNAGIRKNNYKTNNL